MNELDCSLGSRSVSLEFTMRISPKWAGTVRELLIESSGTPKSSNEKAGDSSMPGYFSFQKLITPQFVKSIYVLGLITLTVGGIGLAIWAGLGLRSATLPTRIGVYYIAIGAGIAIVGNLSWRVLCETWIVLFNIHTLLSSIEKDPRREPIHRELLSEEPRVELRQVTQPEREARVTSSAASVLGLS